MFFSVGSFSITGSMESLQASRKAASISSAFLISKLLSKVSEDIFVFSVVDSVVAEVSSELEVFASSVSADEDSSVKEIDVSDGSLPDSLSFLDDWHPIVIAARDTITTINAAFTFFILFTSEKSFRFLQI